MLRTRKKNHKFAACCFKKEKCRKCNRKGHTAEVCHRHSNSTVHYNNNIVSADVANRSFGNESTDSEQCLYHLNEIENDEYCLKLRINGIAVKFEIDSGASMSVCSLEFYEKYFADIPIQKSDVVLSLHNNTALKPVGKIKVNFEYNSMKHTGQLLIIENGGKPLVGREWLRALGFKPNFESPCYNMSSDAKLKSLLTKYDTLFGENLGCYQYGQCLLNRDEFH